MFHVSLTGSGKRVLIILKMGIIDKYKQRKAARKAQRLKRQLESAEETAQIIEDSIKEQKLDKQLAKVKFFPGSQAEYEAMVGYYVEPIDTQQRDFGIAFQGAKCIETLETKRRLVTNNIEAIINCTFSAEITFANNYYLRYGLPVAKIKDPSEQTQEAPEPTQ